MSKMRLELGQERRSFARQAAVQMQQRRKRQEGAKHRFTDAQKEQALKMRAEGMSLSATVRVIGASVPTLSACGKKGALARESLTRFLAWRAVEERDGVRWRMY